MAETEVKEVSIGTLPMKEFKEARSKGMTSVPVGEPAEETEQVQETEEAQETEPERPKGKGGFQKRIDKLIKEKSSLEERAAAAEKRAAELEAKGKPEEKKPASDEPKRADFGTDEEYWKAQARYEVRQELKAQKEAEAKAADEAKMRESFEAYNANLIKARSEIEDFDEVVGASDAPLPQGVVLAIIEMENGPEVAYYLGKNPEVREELLSMTPHKAIGKAWKISVQLGGEGKQPEEKEEAAEEEEKPKAKIATKAAPPIKPVGGGSTRSSVPLGEMDMASYKKARAAGRTR